jgi:redox-sensitive bicupin YhaK (pirin superfamily)
MMPILCIRDARVAHPTGDPNFSVMQCMPAAIPEHESDPFLMCDEVGPILSTGAYGNDTDEGFSVDWHGHHGMDIMSYFVKGRGRHADSMGNRETFDSPGFQWMSVGSGIEHAEGGGTPAGEYRHSFQIWLRMPLERMEDDPRYGTVSPAEIPIVEFNKGRARVLAGSLEGCIGPAQYAVTVQILDVELEADAEWTYTCPDNMDNVIFYAFAGSAVLNDKSTLRAQQVCRFDASGPRRAVIRAGKNGYRCLVFTGKMTNEKIVWHGPFVCSSKQHLRDCFRKYQMGEFPPKRVPWNYRDVSKMPKQ